VVKTPKQQEPEPESPVKEAPFFRNASNMSQDIARLLGLINARTTAAAQMFLAMIPILMIYPFLQKYFTTGLVMGSVKG